MRHLVRMCASCTDTTYTVGLVAPQSTQLPWAASGSAVVQPQQLNSRILLEVPPWTSSTSRKSTSSNLMKNRIPGKQMSCTWRNFALYLISSVCDEPTADFNQCRFWKLWTYLPANLGHKAQSTHSRSPTGDVADKGRLDILLWPGTDFQGLCTHSRSGNTDFVDQSNWTQRNFFESSACRWHLE